MREMILALDLGTTALKIAVFDNKGELLGATTEEYSLMTPKTTWVEEDPEVYWDSFKKGLAKLQKRVSYMPGEIRSLAMSAQGETLFFIDNQGKSLRNAIVWMDNRAQEEAEALEKKFGNETCYKVTGQVSFEPCWPASKILWVKKNEPDVFKKTAYFLLIEDYFIYRMTGKLAAEGSLLCSTTYWNINTKHYWREMLNYLEINENQLPEIYESGVAVAEVLPEIAQELGLSSDTMVCTGALDQAAGAIGVGNISEGMFSENIGAALAICAPVDKPVFDPNRNMPLHYFAIENKYMIHSFTTGGMTLRWFRDVFCEQEINVANNLGIDSYDILGQFANEVPPGSEGLMMLPHLTGSLAPDVNSQAKGVYFGFTLKHKKPHFVRSIMESVGYIIKRNIEALNAMGIDVNEIRSLGGGSKSSVWNQIKADITEKQLITMQSKEAACLGAAILAGKAVGIFKSVEEAVASMAKVNDQYKTNPDNVEVYRKGFEHYKLLFKDMEKMFVLSSKE